MKNSIGLDNGQMTEKAKKTWIAIAKGGAQILAALGFLLLVWWIAYSTIKNELIIPKISDCIKEMVDLLGKSWFWKYFFATVGRVLIAFVISFVFALIFAIIAYMVPSFGGFFAPIVTALRSLPTLAVTLALLALFKAGGTPIAVAFLALFPMLYTGILAALSGIDKELLDIGRVYCTSAKSKIFRVYLPLSAPYILRESAAALSFSLKLVVSAEVVASTARSLGGLMEDAQGYDLPRLFALVIVTFIVGLILELLVGAFMTKVDKA